MPKTANPTADTSNADATAPVPPSIAELESAYQTAMAALQEASDNVLRVAQGGGDLPAIEAAVTAKKTAETAAARAESAFKQAKFIADNAERMAAGVAAKEFLASILTEDAIVNAFKLGIVGLHITADGDGVLHATVNDGVTKGAPRAVRAAAGGGSGTVRRGKKRWSYNGGEYTSKELLLEFGGDAGAQAVDKAEHWQEPRWGDNGDTPLAHNPGFDKAVTKLAGDIGAVDLSKAA